MARFPRPNRYFYPTTSASEIQNIIVLCESVGITDYIQGIDISDGLVGPPYTGIKVDLVSRHYRVYYFVVPEAFEVSLLELILRLEKVADE